MHVAPQPKPTRRRWRYLLGIIVALAFGLYVGRHHLLQGVVQVLVVEDAVQNADAVYVQGRGNTYATAGNLFLDSKVNRVLVGSGPLERIVELGIIPDRGTAGRDRLIHFGVPAQAITVLGRPDWDMWDEARRVVEWMKANPGTTVIMTCGRYESRRARMIFHQLLGSEATRLKIMPIAPHRYEDSNWWQCDDGRREVVVESLRLAYVVIAGERSAPCPSWDPDVYEGALK